MMGSYLVPCCSYALQNLPQELPCWHAQLWVRGFVLKTIWVSFQESMFCDLMRSWPNTPGKQKRFTRASSMFETKVWDTHPQHLGGVSVQDAFRMQKSWYWEPNIHSLLSETVISIKILRVTWQYVGPNPPISSLVLKDQLLRASVWEQNTQRYLLILHCWPH